MRLTAVPCPSQSPRGLRRVDPGHRLIPGAKGAEAQGMVGPAPSLVWAGGLSASRMDNLPPGGAVLVRTIRHRGIRGSCRVPAASVFSPAGNGEIPLFRGKAMGAGNCLSGTPEGRGRMIRDVGRGSAADSRGRLAGRAPQHGRAIGEFRTGAINLPQNRGTVFTVYIGGVVPRDPKGAFGARADSRPGASSAFSGEGAGGSRNYRRVVRGGDREGER